MIWMLHGFFRDFPNELLDAAEIDGLGPIRTLSGSSAALAPGLGVATLFGFLVAWNEFVIALTLTRTPAGQTHAGRHLDADHPVPGAVGRDDGGRRDLSSAGLRRDDHHPARAWSAA